MRVFDKLFRFQNNFSPFQLIFDSFQAGLQVRCNRLTNHQLIKSSIPLTNPTFYKVPYHEQYESRDTTN